MKKFVSLILCLMLIVSLATTAFAANITFTAGAPGAEYTAFRLLNATHSTEANSYAYTVNPTYKAVLKEVTGITTDKDEDIVAHISALDTNGIRAFADAVYAKIKDMDADATTKTDVMENLAEGYYLIAETALGETDNDTYSLVMLDTLGKENITVKTKESYPTVDKKVLETNDSSNRVEHQDSLKEYASHDIGDNVTFQISGTVSGSYDQYRNYYYSFEDTMSAGLTFNNDIKVTVGSTDITDHFTITHDDHSFTANANLKDISLITHSSVIVLTYTAQLNENAVSGTTGNTNTVHLEFQNDPYATEDPEEPGTTPEDITVVFTFDTIVNKVDSNNKPLEGAGFTLYKWSKNDQQWLPVGEEIKDVTKFRFEGLDEGRYALTETTVPDGYNKAEDFEFRIVAEYDTTKDPVELVGIKVTDMYGDVISSADAGAAEGGKAVKVTFNVTLGEGEISTNIVNKTGTELPTTGGMGTTLIYAVGGILVLAAIILLVTKKRMSSAE